MHNDFLSIEHIGIAVENIETAITKYSLLFGCEPYRREIVESEGVETVFFQLGTHKVELLASLNIQSPIQKFLNKRGSGIHHIAYAVADIKETMQRLQKQGFRLLNEAPKKGAENKWVCFIHPKDAEGVLTEICQDIN